MRPRRAPGAPPRARLVAAPVLPLAAALLAIAPAPARADEALPLDPRVAAAAASLADETRRELGEGHSVKVVRGVFVLASDAGPALTARAEGTIGRMVDALYKDFLERRPTRPLRVYCFGAKGPYDAFVRRVYGHAPSTPFGFYVSRDRRMVMNIATGTGTLAHELVHPLVAEDFPAVPSWFNEGFASLFEQSTFTEDGRAKGLTNWRLAGLQEALREGTAPSLRALMRTTTDEFYGPRSGVHYALARYLCYFLQEHGALPAYYAEFRRDARRDPTGIEALERVVGVPLDEVEAAFLPFTRKLRFDR
jgi:hypothetical protein